MIMTGFYVLKANTGMKGFEKPPAVDMRSWKRPLSEILQTHTHTQASFHIYTHVYISLTMQGFK